MSTEKKHPQESLLQWGLGDGSPAGHSPLPRLPEVQMNTVKEAPPASSHQVLQTWWVQPVNHPRLAPKWNRCSSFLSNIMCACGVESCWLSPHDDKDGLHHSLPTKEWRGVRTAEKGGGKRASLILGMKSSIFPSSPWMKRTSVNTETAVGTKRWWGTPSRFQNGF